jgi:hypothetical protein
VDERRAVQKLTRVAEGIKSRLNRPNYIRHAQIADSDEFFLGQFYSEVKNDYAEVCSLKRAWLEEHDGKELNQAISGIEFANERGTCYLIETLEKANSKTISRKIAEESLLSDLKLLFGVREATEFALKERGYKSINNLVEHSRFGVQARRFIELVDELNTSELIELIGKRFSKSHPLVLQVSGFHAIEELLFIDIETLGLFSSPIIVIGLAKVVDEALSVIQYVLRDLCEEPAALTALFSHIDEHSALVTFNGRAFDVPYLEQRLAYYQIPGDLQRAHFDVLHFARRKWGGTTPDCRLGTLQKYLFGARKADIPSALVPEFYETYLQTGNIGPLLAIVEHNRQDLVALAQLFFKVCEG